MKRLRSYQPGKMIAGCDEAGRGCIAGPVFAAAVILPKGYRNSELNDSKKMSLRSRISARADIEKKAVAWSVSMVLPTTIDRINILNASILAMHYAIRKLKSAPEHLLIDGNRFHPFYGVSHTCVIKGDGKYKSIAAASILAKTYRDEYMKRLHEHYPDYKWDDNKGYPTEFHRAAVARCGPSPHHRMTFRMTHNPQQLTFF